MATTLENHPRGLAFSDALMREVKARFLLVDHDHHGRERLYFDNAGGSFRLKAAAERFAAVDAIPDNAERIHATAVELQQIQAKAGEDLRTILHAQGGSVYASLTASGAMFDMVRAVAENVPGTNMVTTVLEHPSAFDAMSLYASRLGRELRVAKSNPVTGGVDVEEIVRLVDKDTCLLNVIYASNISGAKLDMERSCAARAPSSPTCTSSWTRCSTRRTASSICRRRRWTASTSRPTSSSAAAARGSRGCPSARPCCRTTSSPARSRTSGTWAVPRRGSSRRSRRSSTTCAGSAASSAMPPSAARCSSKASERIELHERALLAALLDGTGNATGLREMRGVEVFLDHEDLTRRDLILAHRASRHRAARRRWCEYEQARRHRVRARGDEHLLEADAGVLRARRHGARLAAALPLDGRHGEIPAGHAGDRGAVAAQSSEFRRQARLC
jgi:cysteine desulfurase/selenocysteine lyase